METLYAANKEMGIEELSQKIKKLTFPVMIADNNLVIVARNTKATYKLLKLRIGSNIGRVVSKFDLSVLQRMKSGDSESVGVKAGDGSFAYVLRYEGHYLFCFKAITALLNRKLSELDAAFKRSVGVGFSNDLQAVKNGPSGTKKALRHLTYTTKCYALIAQFGNNAKVACSSADAVNFFVKMFRVSFPEIKITNTSLCGENLTLECNLEDFFMFLCAAVSICLRGAGCKGISLQNVVCFDHFGVVVSCDGEFDEETATRLCDDGLESKTFDCEQDFLIDAMLLRCLAVFNGWDFNVRRDVIERGKLQFSLFLPSTSGDNSLSLRSSRLNGNEFEYYKRIIMQGLMLGREN